LAQLGRGDTPPHISILDPVFKLVVNLVVLKRLLLLVELLLIHPLLLRFLNFLKRQS
jgi:hypothetical protein